MPPRFGVSSALTGHASASAATKTSAPRFVTFICSSLGRPALSVEPQPRQVLVDEMRRGDLEALEVGPVRNNAVPPQGPDLVRLLVEHVSFELTHQRALLRRIGLMQHFFVERDER